MNRTLLLGCSHTAGPYTPQDKIDYSNPGYASLLADKFDCEWKMYSFPGDGLLAFSTTLKYLEIEGKLDSFDNIIIQLTSEPRMNIYSRWDGAMDFIMNTIDLPNPNNVVHTVHPRHRGIMKFSLVGRMLHELYDSFFKIEKSEWIDVVNEVTQAEQAVPPIHEKQMLGLMTAVNNQSIKHICTRHNITLHTFGWNAFHPAQLQEYKHTIDDTYIFERGELLTDIIKGRHGKEFLNTNITSSGEHAFPILSPIIAEIIYTRLISVGYSDF